jgi:pimeloyl-ACP methyl ester carboxylesterase
VRGEEIYVQEWGEGPPLLLIHGFPSSSQSWELVMQALANRFRMIAPDQVGFGRSTRRPRRPLDGDSYADRAADLMDVLGIDRADIAGLSWGGAVAQRLAVRHPDRVRRLALVASVSGAHPLRLGDRDLLGLALATLAPPLGRAAVRRYLSRSTDGALSAAMLDRLARGYVDPLRMPNTLPLLRRFVRATAATPRAEVSRITALTLVIVPDADRIVPPAAGRELATLIPRARLEVIPGAGHSVQFEAADRVAQLIGGFLAS